GDLQRAYALGGAADAFALKRKRPPAMAAIFILGGGLLLHLFHSLVVGSVVGFAGVRVLLVLGDDAQDIAQHLLAAGVPCFSYRGVRRITVDATGRQGALGGQQPLQGVDAVSQDR